MRSNRVAALCKLVKCKKIVQRMKKKKKSNKRDSKCLNMNNKEEQLGTSLAKTCSHQ